MQQISSSSFNIVTPCVWARGEVIAVRRMSSVATKIIRSRVLGICAWCNYYELVDIGEKLVSVRFEIAECGSLALQTVRFLFSMPPQPHPLHVLT